MMTLLSSAAVTNHTNLNATGRAEALLDVESLLVDVGMGDSHGITRKRHMLFSTISHRCPNQLCLACDRRLSLKTHLPSWRAQMARDGGCTSQADLLSFFIITIKLLGRCAVDATLAATLVPPAGLRGASGTASRWELGSTEAAELLTA